MNVTLKPFNFAQAVARAGLDVDGRALRPAQVGHASKADFGRALAGALASVSATQALAGQMQREVQLGNPTVSLEATMVAMQKSGIAFQATLQVRNKLVQAYSDVMNMQI